MAGRSELPSGKPSSFRRTELRLGEPEPPAKKRIIDVAVLVEPVQLARVSGYRATCAARCRPLASLVEVVGARRQAFARSLSGRRRQGRRRLEWLPRASRQGSERSGNQSRTAQLAASFDRCRGAHAAIRLGFCDFAVLFAQPLLPTPSGLAHTGAFPALGDRSEWCQNDYKSEIKITKPAQPCFERRS